MATTLLQSAWKTLEKSVISYEDKPVGTVAAVGQEDSGSNYDQCFTRDFFVSGLAFLMDGRTDMVRNFLSITLELQSQKKQMDCFKAGQGLMPASFKVEKDSGQECINADFGEKAVGRVAPVDSGFWWMLLLRAYMQVTDDQDFIRRTDVQDGIQLVLDLCLVNRFDMFPTMLVPDGSFMIDRRMGVYGYPLEIQVLFYATLRAAQEVLCPETENSKTYLKAANERANHLVYHLRQYYWLDIDRVDEIHCTSVENSGEAAGNPFNIYPDTIPSWLVKWLRPGSGFFVGNLGPSRLDYRFFTQGNLLSVITSLADEYQAKAIFNLVEERWSDLVGKMPLKCCFPALKGQDWKTLTGCDPKNTPWSYHNGGHWPFLLWLLAAAAQRTDHEAMLQRALEISERRILSDRWLEYYDGRRGSLSGRYARRQQTWTAAGVIIAHQLLDNPTYAKLVSFEPEVVAPCSLDSEES